MKYHIINLLIFSSLLFGCKPKENPYPFGETSYERASFIKTIIKRNHTIPGNIFEAECIEEKIGDGFLGPADYTFFAKISIDENQVESWKQALGEQILNRNYNSPKIPKEWWVSESDFMNLKFYPPNIFGRNNGWVGISNDGATLYIMTYTM